MIAGTVLSAMFLQLLEGHRAWRDAGSDAAEASAACHGRAGRGRGKRKLSRAEVPPLSASE